MRRKISTAALALLTGVSFSAAAQTVVGEKTAEEMGLKVVDEKGCTLQFSRDGTKIPAILFAVNIYNQEGADNNAIVAAIEQAISNGCPLNETDEQGLTPLNAAILFNEPFLVALLLEKGANPDDRIVRPGKSTNGMNSYEFAEMLHDRDSGEDRGAVMKLLREYRARP